MTPRAKHETSDAELDAPLPEFTRLMLTPVELLLRQLNSSKNINSIFLEAQSDACKAMGISREVFWKQLHDPFKAAPVVAELETYVELGVKAQLFVQTQTEKMNRRIDFYLENPGEREGKLCRPEREDVRSAMREAIDRLTLNKGLKETELDDNQGALLQQEVTTILMERQNNNPLIAGTILKRLPAPSGL